MSKHYTKEHEWVSIDGEVATVGITDYAQEQLGDIVMIELPKEGSSINQGDESVIIESVKAASEIKSPVSGEVLEANENVVANVELANTSPLDQGWMYKVRLTDKDQINELLDEKQYQDYLKELDS